jgi:hypothetical protein
MRHLASLQLRWVARLLVLGLGGCVESYMPGVVSAPNSYLVVDGFINGNGRTRIKLSRSENVAATTAPPVEKGATIYIIDDTGTRYALRETAIVGSYNSDSLLLNPGRNYRLRISLGTGSSAPTYESDLVPLKVTPAFDSVEAVRQNGQVQWRLSTHDASGQSRYYRWNYTETWEFHSAFNSVIEANRGTLRKRATSIYTCWHTERPSTIVHTSTAGLSQDQVNDWQLLSFSDRAERLKIRYSLLVSQYVETAEEFAYNEVLRKNTEAVGTVNDPLPVQLTGNVHRVGNAAEPVLGFVGAHTVQQQRLFLTPQGLGLPLDWAFEDPYKACELSEEATPNPADITDPLRPGHTRLFASVEAYPVGIVGDSIANTGSSRFCVDCTVRGSNQKPSFW